MIENNRPLLCRVLPVLHDICKWLDLHVARITAENGSSVPDGDITKPWMCPPSRLYIVHGWGGEMGSTMDQLQLPEAPS